MPYTYEIYFSITYTTDRHEGERHGSYVSNYVDVSIPTERSKYSVNIGIMGGARNPYFEEVKVSVGYDEYIPLAAVMNRFVV